MVIQYFRELFSTTLDRVLLLFDSIGIILFFQPVIAPELIVLPTWVYTMVAVIVVLLFLYSNYTLYARQELRIREYKRKLEEAELSWEEVKADLHVTVVNRSLSICFPDGAGYVERLTKASGGNRGFHANGVPMCAKLWLRLRVENHGFREGALRCEVSQKTSLPDLVQSGNDSVEVYGDFPWIEAGSPAEGDLWVIFPITETSLERFIYDLLQVKEQEFTIVLDCYTEQKIGEDSGPSEQRIPVDFSEFYSELETNWRGKNDFKEAYDALKRIRGE